MTKVFRAGYSALLVCSALLAGCSDPGSAAAPDPEEALVHNVLFGNNPTGRTYFAQYASPVAVYIEGECTPMTAPYLERTQRIYDRHGITARGKAIDGPYYPGQYISELLAGITGGVPHSSRLVGLPENRRKRGSGNLDCVKSVKYAHLARPVNIYLTRDAVSFAKLWRGAPPSYGYVSGDRRRTPACFVAVRANSAHEIMQTDVHVLMPAWDLAAFRSTVLAGCAVRGMLASFGASGALSMTDAALLRASMKREQAPSGTKGNYWDHRLIAATQLYDRGGATWPEVRAEWRRRAGQPAHGGN